MNLVGRYNNWGHWYDGKKHIDNLLDSDIKEIQEASIYCFRILFGKLDPEQTKTVLLKLNEMHSNCGIKVVGRFFEWLLDNKIPFDVEWKWNRTGIIGSIRNYRIVKRLKEEIDRRRSA